MAKMKPVPAFLQKGGGNKIAQGQEPPGAKSKKLGKVRPGMGGGIKKPGAGKK
jgi:hypothetical protein